MKPMGSPRSVLIALLALTAGCAGSLNRMAEKGDVDGMSRLLDRGARVNRVGLDGRTPLGAAIEGGEPAAVKLLLDRGADVEAPAFGAQWGRRLDTPLQAAAESGKLEIVRLLLERGAKVDAAGELAGGAGGCVSEAGLPPLALAAAHERADVARLLLSKGAASGASRERLAAAAQKAKAVNPVMCPDAADLAARAEAGRRLLETLGAAAAPPAPAAR